MFSSVCSDIGGLAGSLLVELVTKCSLIHWKTVPIQTSSSSSSSVLSLAQVSLQFDHHRTHHWAFGLCQLDHVTRCRFFGCTGHFIHLCVCFLLCSCWQRWHCYYAGAWDTTEHNYLPCEWFLVSWENYSILEKKNLLFIIFIYRITMQSKHSFVQFYKHCACYDTTVCGVNFFC